MHIQVVSKGIDVSEALREEIMGRVEEVVGKYFSRPGDAVVAVAREGAGFRVDCSLHLPSGVILNAQGEGGDAYRAAEGALSKLEKRLRRYKRRLKNHHNTQKPDLPAAETPFVVLQGSGWGAAGDEDEDEDDGAVDPGGEPVIIAETPGEVRTLTVSTAVMELEAASAPFLVFRNAAHGGVNIVYMRPDGNVGWIDPERAARKAG
ncbi:MAG: ribosome-associated translation inhibitor RaiA [Maricaulaceae bacterium]|nr:ribosome-associated translation inhibitor RaiA [Maricaulaceae bacterium]